jgi:hypothetical protein
MEIYSILRVHILDLFLENNNMAECDGISYIITPPPHTYIYMCVCVCLCVCGVRCTVSKTSKHV